MRRLLGRVVSTAALCAVALASQANADVLFDGGPIITHPGGMTGAVAGADRSAISPGGSLFGSGATGALRLADDFVLSSDSTINSMTFYGYLTGATAPGATALTVRIWDGTPGAAGSNIIFGDTTTNIMTASGWASSPSNLGIFRTTSTDTTGNTRRIQSLTAGGLNINLAAGTYWVDYNFTGVSFTPPVSSPTQHVLGNALQFNTTWGPALDAGTGGGQIAVPFLVEGFVPEPTSAMALMGFGVLLAARRRR